MVFELSEGVSVESCGVDCLVRFSCDSIRAEDVNKEVAEFGRLIVLGYTTVGFFGTVGCRVTKSYKATTVISI